MFDDEPLPFDTELGPTHVGHITHAEGDDTGTLTGAPVYAWRAEPVARSTDPGTSWAAAGSVKDVRESQREVLKLFQLYGAMHDEQLVRRAHRHGVKQSVSGLRTRRKELVDGGYLHDTGEKTRTEGGRSTIVWGVPDY